MALIPPEQVIYPQNRIKRVSKVLYDGTKPPYYEFSIAELDLQSGSKAIGIRHDRNEWNENTEEKGYPTCRPGNPTWFIVPDISRLLPILNYIFSKGFDSQDLQPYKSDTEGESLLSKHAPGIFTKYDALMKKLA